MTNTPDPTPEVAAPETDAERQAEQLRAAAERLEELRARPLAEQKALLIGAGLMAPEVRPLAVLHAELRQTLCNIDNAGKPPIPKPSSDTQH